MFYANDGAAIAKALRPFATKAVAKAMRLEGKERDLQRATIVSRDYTGKLDARDITKLPNALVGPETISAPSRSFLWQTASKDNHKSPEARAALLNTLLTVIFSEIDRRAPSLATSPPEKTTISGKKSNATNATPSNALDPEAFNSTLIAALKKQL